MAVDRPYRQGPWTGPTDKDKDSPYGQGQALRTRTTHRPYGQAPRTGPTTRTRTASMDKDKDKPYGQGPQTGPTDKHHGQALWTRTRTSLTDKDHRQALWTSLTDNHAQTGPTDKCRGQALRQGQGQAVWTKTRTSTQAFSPQCCTVKCHQVIQYVCTQN